MIATAALVVGGAHARILGPAPSVGAAVSEVAIFYYPWYGTVARDGIWQHWQQHGNSPPAQIASGWFPVRGAYSSSDPAVVRSQMHEIAAAGVQTVIISWWGPGSVEAERLPAVAQAARAAGLHVALHVEPYPGRTPALLEPEIRAFEAAGITDFYLYDSTTTSDADWHALNERLSGVRLFANTNLPGKALAGGFAGLYTYGQPRVGTPDFCDVSQANFGSSYFRFVNKDDIVTRVPPRELAYWHGGHDRYINHQGVIQEDPVWWQIVLDRVKAGIGALRQLQVTRPVTDLIADHAIADYIKAIGGK